MDHREIEFAGTKWLVLDEYTRYIVRREPLEWRRFDPESNDFETKLTSTERAIAIALAIAVTLVLVIASAVAS